jgi:ApbE superfamily uncharacterized protein (UPF0280 family)
MRQCYHFVEKPQYGSEYIRELEDGTVVVHRGPMLMSIFASSGGKPNVSLAKEGAKKALEVLETLARFRSLITKNIGEIHSIELMPPVVQKMVLASRKFGDRTVTPLIAVAGAGADEVADFIFNTGQASKVVMNNGGDIAIRLEDDEVVRVGIKTNLTDQVVTHVMTVTRSNKIGGVATSGFGGRSFTRGVANAAVAIAEDATSADLAATLIGNATDVEGPTIVKVLGKDLYPATDIPDLWVTKSVGHLEKSQIEEALDQGIQKAETFKERGLILGAFLAVKDRHRISNSIMPLIQILRTT